MGNHDTAAPSLLDAAALLAEKVEELVVRGARDVHEAVADRVGTGTRLIPGAVVPDAAQRGISGAVYGGIGLALRGLALGLDKAADAAAERSWGPGLEETGHGRSLHAAVNGLIGDRLVEERPRMAIRMAVRKEGRDVPPEALAEAFPDATGRVVVLLHGLCESESAWNLHRDRVGSTYADMLRARGWTPVLLRANTGLPVRENGVALASLMGRLVEEWPVPVTRVALVGHSMGGLVMRAAGAVTDPDDAWSRLVSDVVTLGTPHLGAPMATFAGWGSRTLGRVPETTAFGRILDQRSAGILDLVLGLGEEVPPLPHARYHLVAGTVRHRDHVLSRFAGDLMVRPSSAFGVDRVGRTLFPTGEVLHVDGAGHFALLNHPQVHTALRRWLA